MKRLPRAAAVLAAATALLSTTSVPALAAPPVVERATYSNAVSKSFADTFADPSLIRGLDGWWYAYGTSDPLREGDTTPAEIPVARSHDLATWDYVGTVFSDANRPSWAADGAGLWAPDIRYVDGQYRLYYVVTNTTQPGVNDSAIGVATAPTPAGPWTDSGAPVVAPRPGANGAAGDDFLWTFDPSAVTDGGRQYLFYGSYYGGIYVSELAADGRTTTGTPTQVAIDNKFEGAYVVKHGGYWYLFASTADCCAGPTTGYSVQVGRSKKITGPYVDAQGTSLTASRTGGTPVLNQNGNRWVGAGHNAVATDLAGRDWIVYHAIDRADPYLNGTSGINERPMLIDRLDWVDGWPAVRAGRGPSAGEQQGPATGGRWSTDLAKGVPARWRTTGPWLQRSEEQAGGFVRSNGRATVLSGRVGSSARVEADLRSDGPSSGLTLRSGSTTVRAVVDPGAGRLRLQEQRGGRTVDSSTTRLPAGFTAADWHAVALQVRDGRAEATITHARLGDPVASTTLKVRRATTVDRAGAFANGAAVDVDNLSALPVAKPVTKLASTPVPKRLDRSASDNFSGDRLGAGWSWVRQDDQARVNDGVLRWPTEAADLNGPGGNAGVLLRDPGEGDWTIETKVKIDLGTDDVRNYQQAGIVAYADDDSFVRLSHVAIWNTRQTEFGHEQRYAGSPEGVLHAGTIVGPPAATTWLRITHRVDPANGEHELRGWTSRDGKSWVKGGVWTLPAGSDLEVGLVSHGGAGATARFDWFRLYR